MVQLVGEELLGEAAGEVHQVVGRDRTGNCDLHAYPNAVRPPGGAPSEQPAYLERLQTGSGRRGGTGPGGLAIRSGTRLPTGQKQAGQEAAVTATSR